MPQVAYHPMGGLEDLEHGLKSLLQSQLMAIPAFKDMYGAVQRHHRDIKLAHLTGTARDLQAKAMRDTKFYNILMNMLCEVARQARDQREGLQQVHTWYLTNSHVLLCGPHFGKQYKRDEAKEILHRATTVKLPSHIKTAKGKELSQDMTSFQPDTLSGEDFPDLWHLQGDLASSTHRPEDSDLDQSLGSLQSDDDEFPVEHSPCARAATNSPELGDFRNSHQFDSRTTTSSLGQDLTPTEELGVPDVEPASVSPPRILMRPKTATSMEFSLRQQSGNLNQAVTDIRNVVHPIASLVNPYAIVSKPLSHRETDHRARRPDVGRRALSAKPLRSHNLQAWQTFTKKRSHGQDVINNLNLVGRSSKGLCIRYSAHDLRESSEAHSHDFLKLYAKHTESSSKPAGAEGNLFVEQTLEEFYQTVENMKPNHSHRTFHITRAKSASAANKTRTCQETAARGSQQTRPTPITDRPSQAHQVSSHEEQQTGPANSETGVSLDRLISVIDTVTDNMVYHKEKLTPEPQLAFRQPSTSGVLSPRELVSSCSNDVNIDSVHGTLAGIHQLGKITSRPFSSSLACSTAARRDDMPEKHQRTKVRCASAGVLDWRGRITPESVRYKWSQTRCGGHTYLKKWYQPKSGSAGSTSASRRPKTAPTTARDRRRTQAARDGTMRAAQTASHTATVIDPADIQSMLQVQRLLSSDHRPDTADSFSIDGLTWRKLIRNTTKLPAMEYLSFVSPSVTAEQQSEKCTSYRDKSESRVQADDTSCLKIREQVDNLEVNIHVPHHHFDEEALNVAVRQELGSASSNHSLQSPDSPELHGRADKKNDGNVVKSQQSSGDYKAETMTTKVERSAGRLPGQPRCATFERSAGRMPGQARSATFERSAGRMPGQTHSAIFRSNSLREANIKVPPIRSPASIPSPQMNFEKCRQRNGQLLEVELHTGRGTRSADYMDTARRSSQCLQCPPVARLVTTDSIISTSLQISRLPVTIRDSSRTARSARHRTASKQPRDQRVHIETAVTSPASQHSDGAATTLLPQASASARSINKIGRPVPEVFQTPDPDDVLQAVKLRSQAAAAVDIQRIFRGYVTRNKYKSLLCEERHKREDTRSAAVKIQRMYRSHLLRKHAIYNRPPLDPEVIQWSKDLKELQSDNLAKRRAKLASSKNEIGLSHREAKQRLAVIGPHVEVYSAYHTKRAGPTSQQLNLAAVKVQKIIRGWLLRRKLEKLNRKAALHGTSFQRQARDYKAILKRVQQQHGVDKPKTPFSIQCFQDYMDLRRRYESIFENKSFEGELDPGSLPTFFAECDMYPSQSEIEQALDVTLQGHTSHRHDRGLTKRQVLDLIFYIYVPPAAGLENTRRSTWMNPIIDGQEARQLLGHPCVEAAPLAPCMQLVIEAKQAQRQREQKHKEEVERARVAAAERRAEDENKVFDVVEVDTSRNVDGDKQTSNKSKKVTLQESENTYH